MGYQEFTIEGRNAVIEAYRSGKPIDKLFILDGCQDGPMMTIKREAKKHDTLVKYVTKERLDQLSETGKHQGVIAYAAAYVRETLGEAPERMEVEASGNIIKNVKSVIVPNTGGMKGIAAAAAAGVISGRADRKLEVLSHLTQEDQERIHAYVQEVPIAVRKADSPLTFDLIVTGTCGVHEARVRIAGSHTNVVRVEKDGKILLDKAISDEPCSRPDGEPEEKTVTADGAAGAEGVAEEEKTPLTILGIVEFAEAVRIEDVQETLERQIRFNTAISEEGLRGDYGANVGSVLLATYGDDVKVRARAAAAAIASAVRGRGGKEKRFCII